MQRQVPAGRRGAHRACDECSSVLSEQWVVDRPVPASELQPKQVLLEPHRLALLRARAQVAGAALGPECSAALRFLFRRCIEQLAGMAPLRGNPAATYTAATSEEQALVRSAACFLSSVFQVRCSCLDRCMCQSSS